MIQIAQIGCGYWGPNLLRNFQQSPNCVVVGLADPAEKSRKSIAEKYPAIPLHENPESVINNPAVDAVVIAAPARFHYELTRTAILAGKDVMVEKPLALKYKEGKELVGLAEDQGRVLMVGHILEYHPAIQKIRDFLERGDLGELQYIASSRLNLGKIRSEENVLWSFAPHDIAIVQRLAGTLPGQVMATGSTFLQEKTTDIAHSHLFFRSGVHAHVHVSWLNPFKEQRLSIVGSKAMVTYNDVRKELLLYPHLIEMGSSGPPVPTRADPQPIQFGDDEPLARECTAFLEAVRTRIPPLTDGPSGLDVLQTLEALQTSMDRNGKKVQLAEITVGTAA
jgi:predicted dehydrogenase